MLYSRVRLDQNVDWTAGFRGKSMYSIGGGGKGLLRWIVITPSKMVQDVKQFISQMEKAASGMGFPLKNPKM